MANIHLTIVSPEGRFYDGDAEKIIVRTTTGDVCILPNHIDYAAAIGSGEARVTTANGETRKAFAEGGLLHVSNNEVQLIGNRFEWRE